jgi:hypothetical protein
MSGMWDHLPVEMLIAQNVPPYGLAPKRWLAQLEAIRGLPELEPPHEEAA